MGKNFIDNFKLLDESGKIILREAFKISNANPNVMSTHVKSIVKYTIRN